MPRRIEVSRRRARIVGIGTSAFYRRGRSPASAFALAMDAVIDTCQDAGIDPKDVDGLVSYSDEPLTASAMVDGLGLGRFRYGAQPLDGSGGGATHAVQLAVDAVESGRAEYVIVFRSLRQESGARFGQPGGYTHEEVSACRRVRQEHPYYRALLGPFSAPFGASVPVQHWALHARRHMHEYGTTSEQFGMVTKTFRAHAARNPAALFPEAITLEEHQASRMIASPLRLLDCCMESDGAGALLVTTEERARDCRKPAVQMLAAAYGTGLGMTSLHGFPGYPSANLRRIAPRLWGEAGIGPDEVDTAQLYDHFSSHVLMALEDLGFCEIGEGGPFVDSGALAWPDGSLPTNTSGGMLAEVYIISMNLLVEGVRQIRGESTCQVEGAETALVTAGGASCPTGALILART